jgi:integrase/recombinase XerC
MRQGLVDKNPAEQLTTPKIPKRLPAFVKEKEMDMLLDGIEFGDDYAGVRNKMIIDLFYGTGIRLSELTNLQLSNIDLSGGVIKVTGKRNKDRIVPLHPSLMTSMPLYVECRNQIFGSQPTNYLFLTDTGKPLYSKFVYRLVKQYLSTVTTLAKKSPHVLRHTFATALLNRGADINAIKELLGHANLAATEIYTHTTFAQLNAIYKQAHPRA